MATNAASAADLIGLAELAWAGGNGATAMALFSRALDVAELAGDRGETRVAAVLGLARGQQYNLVPGLLPVRLHAAYDESDTPRDRARLAAALARCWAYANQPRRARPFALEALDLADQNDDPVLLADALDAALASHWGPEDLARRRDWAMRLDDAVAYLPDLNARLQAQLWGLRSVDGFIAASDPDGSLSRLDDVITAALPGASRVLWQGVFWGGTEQSIIGYGAIEQPRRRGHTATWFLVGLARQKHYLSLYVNAAENGIYLSKYYGPRLGKTRVGSASISFSSTDAIDLAVLLDMVRHAGRLTTWS